MSSFLKRLQLDAHLSLRWKLIIPFLGIIAVVLLFLLPVANNYIGNGIQSEADRQLNETAEAVHSLLTDGEQDVALSGSFVANLPELPFISNNSELLGNTLIYRKDQLQVQELSFYAADFQPGDAAFYYGGPTIARRLQTSKNTADIRDNLILEAIESKTAVSGIAISPQSSQIIGAAPVINDSFNVAGVILTAVFIDDNYIGKISSILDSDLALVKDNAIVASTIDNESSYIDLIQDGFVQENGQSASTTISYKDGTLYRLVSHPLLINNSQQGNILVAKPLNDLLRVQNEIQLILIIFAGLVTLTSIGVGLMAARAFAIPLMTMAEASEEISRGNLDQQVSAPYFIFKDEVTTLGENFNTMTARLKELYNNLENRVKRRTQELEEERNKLNVALEKLEVAHNEAIEANQAKSAFVSLVSHELKAPMTSIKGYADLMAAGATGEMSENQMEFLGIIQQNVIRMNHLVSDLTDISRIESGQLAIDFHSVDLQETIEEVVHSINGQMRQKEQTLIVNIADNLPSARGDRNRIIQIVTNLMSNAMKYTPVGGKVMISVEKTADSMIQVAMQDTGLGISDEDQAQIFQKFFRANDQEARQSPGTGLGLNITKNLVEMQNGRIWFESQFRKGTTFYFTLPIAEENGA